MKYQEQFACVLIGVTATLTLGSFAATNAEATKCRYGSECQVDGDGLVVGLTKLQTGGLPRHKKVTVVDDKGKSNSVTAEIEYATVLACPTNTSPDERFSAGCDRAFKACIPVKDAEGPLVTIFQRLIIPKHKDPTNWSRVNETCWRSLVPGAKNKPELTVSMIKSEFVRTPFARPKVYTQPVGNRTLVNLPTYFRADFTGTGYGPGRVRTVTLLGHKVQIKPVLKSNTFSFGDGTSLGPTVSSGGVYPDGDVRHTYLHRGTVSSSITTVYGGQFAVDGGEFTDLPGTATVTGPVQRIEVLEAQSQLVR